MIWSVHIVLGIFAESSLHFCRIILTTVDFNSNYSCSVFKKLQNNIVSFILCILNCFQSLALVILIFEMENNVLTQLQIPFLCFRTVYHCPFCNLCRVGGGLGVDFFHCMTCNCCLGLKLLNHKCLEKCLETNCPICCDFLFTSSETVRALPCGHYMHLACFQVSIFLIIAISIHFLSCNFSS